MKVVILCGGQGSRIREVSELVPKPMLPIGEYPILWHIMKGYAAHGCKEFVLCLGYKGTTIKNFFLNYHSNIADFTVEIGHQQTLEYHEEVEEAGWRVTLANTGETTMTGGRVWRIRKYVEKDQLFCLSYGDGVADVDIKALIDTHIRSGRVATLTAVRVAGRFGELELDGDRISSFNEKPAVSAGRINGGFMVFDSKRVWKYFDDREELILERDVFERLVKDGELGIYNHDGYWQCMDTPREFQLLNGLWEEGNAPWKIW